MFKNMIIRIRKYLTDVREAYDFGQREMTVYLSRHGSTGYWEHLFNEVTPKYMERWRSRR